jgi:hypothetical protein
MFEKNTREFAEHFYAMIEELLKDFSYVGDWNLALPSSSDSRHHTAVV